MIDQGADKIFAGSIPEIYDRCRVALIFVDYADALAQLANQRREIRIPAHDHEGIHMRLRVAQVERVAPCGCRRNHASRR